MSGLDETRKRSGALTKIISAMPFRYPAIYLLYRHFENAVGNWTLSLYPFGSGYLDAVSRSGIPPGLREFRSQSSVGIVAITVNDTLQTDRLASTAKLVKDRFDLSHIVAIIDNEKIPRKLETVTKNLRIGFITRRHLDDLYSRYKRGMPRTFSMARQWITKTIFEQQATLEHRDARAERESLMESYIPDLRHEYQSGRIVLFLGAGVTKDAGGPDWEELINRLRTDLMNHNPKLRANLDQLSKERFSAILQYLQRRDPLIEAQILAYGLGNGFQDMVRDALYSNPIVPGAILNRIADLCREGKISAIVTYNWDDLLEKALDSALRRTSVNYQVISDDTYSRRNNEIAVYHVHGYLPQDGQGGTLLRFREEEYHELYESPYNWVNHVQIELFREYRCMFIGLSMTDPNLRRLLRIASTKHSIPVHIAWKKWPTHHDLLRKGQDMLDDLTARQNVQCSIPSETRTETVLRVDCSLQDLDLRNLRVNIGWMNDYGDISSILDQISQ